jgi:alpha-1,6-mannosyltransferase
MTSRRVGAALGAALVACITLAVVAAHHAGPTEVSPVTPRGAWNAVWIGALVAAFLLAGAGALWARRGDLRVALVVAVAVQLIPLTAPLLLSKDVYLYWAESRVLVTHHANPYNATPADYPSDPALPYVSESWRAEPTPYGPAWAIVAAAPAALAGDSPTAAEYLYRVLAAIGIVATLLIVAWRTRSAAGVALLGWSPLVAVHFAAGGHGDAVMIAVLAGAIAAGATALGGALWPVAGAFKPLAPVLLPLELASRRPGPRWWLGLVGGGVAVCVIATAVFGTAWVTASTVGAHQTSPLGGVHWLTEAGLRHRYAVTLAGLIFLGVYALLLRSAWRTRRPRFALAAVALCVTSSLLRPWYGLWALALASLEDDAVAAMAAFALSGYLLFGDAVRL